MNITSKYRSLSVQAKAALWFTICSFLQKGISFITVPIFTRLMSTEEYGTYTVYLSWLQILTIMTSLYLFNGVYDNAMAKYEKQRDEYTSAMQGLTLVITGAVFALYCFTIGFLGEDFKSAEIHDSADVSGSAAESGAFLLVGAAAV